MTPASMLPRCCIACAATVIDRLWITVLSARAPTSSHDSAELDSERLPETTGSSEPSRRAPREPFLFLSLQRDDPMAPPARLRLPGLERVAIGGGDGPPAFDAAACAIRLADRYASQHHATLALEGERWVLQDEASINR